MVNMLASIAQPDGPKSYSPATPVECRIISFIDIDDDYCSSKQWETGKVTEESLKLNILI